MKYSYSGNGETWHGQYDTREDAFRAAFRDDPDYRWACVEECEEWDPLDVVRGDSLVETINDEWGYRSDEDAIDASDEDLQILTERVRDVVEVWIKERCLSRFLFEITGNRSEMTRDEAVIKGLAEDVTEE